MFTGPESKDKTIPQWLSQIVRSPLAIEFKWEEDIEVRYDIKKMKKLLVGQIDTAIRNADRCHRVLVSLLTHVGKLSGFRNIDFTCDAWRKCISKFQVKYVLLWFFGLATSWLKYHTAAVFARSVRAEMPPSPFKEFDETPGHFLGGIGYSLVERAMKCCPSVTYNFLMGKKGFPPLAPQELSLSLKQQVTTLLTPQLPRYLPSKDQISRRHSGFSPEMRQVETEITIQTPDDYLRAPYQVRLRHLMSQVSRTVREVFGYCGQQGALGIHLPSFSAHYRRSRTNGGAFKHLMTRFRRFVKRSGWIDPSLNPGTQPGGHFPEAMCSFCEGGDRRSRPVPILVRIPIFCMGRSPFEMFEQPSSPAESPWYRVEDRKTCDPTQHRPYADRSAYEQCQMKLSLSTLMGQFWEEILSVADRQRTVQPVVLSEPFKARVITTGPSEAYWIGKSIQKVVHTILRSHPTFALTGEPVSPEILQKVLGKLPEKHWFHSGDYKSATDLIHPDLSLTAVDTLCECLGFSDPVREVFRFGLCSSTIDSEFGLREQAWGQLMGSPMSFPVLCIINAAINRWFLELITYKDEPRSSVVDGFDYQLTYELNLKDLPLLINGDDIVMSYRESKDSYSFWGKLVADAGLVPSVGKNYCSAEFLIINSTFFKYDCDSVGSFLGPDNFVRIPYLNVGLIHPTYEKVEKFSLDKRVFDLAQCAHTAIAGFDPPTADWIMGRFLNDPTVKQLLSRVKPGVSYFVSKQLGGLGLPRTRSGLLTPQQIGYYTFVATEPDAVVPSDIAPTLPRAVQGLYPFVKMRKSVTDWFRIGELPESSVGNLWTAVLRMPNFDFNTLAWNASQNERDCDFFQATKVFDSEILHRGLSEDITGEDSQELLTPDQITTIILRTRKRILDAAMVQPRILDFSMFRCHPDPIGDVTLCDFPWAKSTISVSEETGVCRSDVSLPRTFVDRRERIKYDWSYMHCEVIGEDDVDC